MKENLEVRLFLKDDEAIELPTILDFEEDYKMCLEDGLFRVLDWDCNLNFLHNYFSSKLEKDKHYLFLSLEELTLLNDLIFEIENDIENYSYKLNYLNALYNVDMLNFNINMDYEDIKRIIEKHSFYELDYMLNNDYEIGCFLVEELEIFGVIPTKLINYIDYKQVGKDACFSGSVIFDDEESILIL